MAFDATSAPLGLTRAAEPWWAEATYSRLAQSPVPLWAPEGSAQDDAPLHALGVGEILAAYGAGTLLPSVLVEHLLQRARTYDPEAKYLWSLIEADCQAADERWAMGAARPLEGVPFAVKSIIDVAGAPVTCGSLTTGDRVAAQDALVVARLRAAGAIPIAMAATTEFAAGSPFNPRHGIAPNPWDATRWTGGSSTGSGAALAARLVPLALGTDTGGSIRVPSAWCGVTGLKPTRGLLPLDGVASLSWTLDHVGPMGRSAADLVLAMAAMAGPPEDDHRAQSTALPLQTNRPDRALRIGVPQGWFDELCDAPVLDAWRAALATMEAAGCILVPFTSAEWLGDLAQAHAAGWDVLLTELAATQNRNAPARMTQDKGLQLRIAQGEQVTGVAYAQGLSQRSVTLARFMAVMDGLKLDVLMTPGIGSEAGDLATVTVEVNGKPNSFQDIIPRNTMMFDLTGMPALMLPSGFGPNGLPLAVQIVGRPFADATCLAAGITFQQLTDFHRAKPQGF